MDYKIFVTTYFIGSASSSITTKVISFPNERMANTAALKLEETSKVSTITHQVARLY